MTYATEHVAASLKAARTSKGLSQRALAQIAGVPQSYISKIESGRVDLRLSSLVDIARALDLELALVPRKAMPAVQSIARPSQSWQFPAGSFPGDRQLKQIQANLSHVSHANPTLKSLLSCSVRFVIYSTSGCPHATWRHYARQLPQSDPST